MNGNIHGLSVIKNQYGSCGVDGYYEYDIPEELRTVNHNLSAFLSSQGEAYIGSYNSSGGLWWVNKSSGKIEKIYNSIKRVDMYEDNRGNVYLFENGLHKIEGKEISLIKTGYYESRYCFENENEIYFTGSNSSLLIYDKNERTIQELSLYGGCKFYKYKNSVFGVIDNTPGGQYIFKISQNQNIEILLRFTPYSSIWHENSHGLFLTCGQHNPTVNEIIPYIYKYNERENTFVPINIFTECNNISLILYENNFGLFVTASSANFGLWKYNNDIEAFEKILSEGFGFLNWFEYEDKACVVSNTIDGGNSILLFDSSGYKNINHTENYYNRFFRDSRGNLFAGASYNTQLLKFNEELGEFEIIRDLKAPYSDFCEGEDGLYIKSGSSILKYAYENKSLVVIQSFGYLENIFRDNNGDIFLTTTIEIYKLNKVLDKFDIILRIPSSFKIIEDLPDRFTLIADNLFQGITLNKITLASEYNNGIFNVRDFGSKYKICSLSGFAGIIQNGENFDWLTSSYYVSSSEIHNGEHAIAWDSGKLRLLVV